MTRIGRILTSQSLEVLTTGLPFCVFKALVGLLLVREGLPAAGALLLLLAAVDGLLNAANLLSLTFLRRRVTSHCLLTAAARRLPRRPVDPQRRADLGNALDVLLSCGLVAAMVGFGGIPRLPSAHLHVWNGAVVLNVLGAGLGRFGAWVSREG
ncbi:MAG: hypothetical protein RL199_1579 [Pseudomonadota bacterium]|jgi:hypothetical protein